MAQQRNPSRGGESDAGGDNRWFYIIFGVIVVAGLGWLLFAGSAPSADLPTPEEFQSLTMEVEADPAVGIAVGSADAPIELMEFADYSCPACANFTGTAGRLLRMNFVEGENAPVRWITYDYVLGGFPNSVSASMAARCAGEQGRYWPMHDLLFARQLEWARSGSPEPVYEELAERAGVDMSAYRECMAEGRYIEEIAAARKYGESLGVNSTPTIFLNGQHLDIVGRDPYRTIEAAIRELQAAGGDSAEGEGASEGAGGAAAEGGS